MISGEHDRDPCPTIPKTFVDPARMNDLSREIKGFSAAAEAVEQAIEDAPDQRQGRPEALVKSVVATCQGRQALGQRFRSDGEGRWSGAIDCAPDGGACNGNRRDPGRGDGLLQLGSEFEGCGGQAGIGGEVQVSRGLLPAGAACPAGG